MLFLIFWKNNNPKNKINRFSTKQKVTIDVQAREKMNFRIYGLPKFL